ncbi:hypothetical protein BDV06DRAFT_171140 [Aspergillus oleicola]
METEFYSSLNWALTTDPTDSLFPATWESSSGSQSGQNTWATEESQPQLDLDLDLLLSASSYPIPDFQDPQFNAQGGSEQSSAEPDSLYGGLVRYGDVGTGGLAANEAAAAPANTSTAKNRVSRSGEPAKKRGRPRKLIGDATVNPEERRRTQVRIAQRAYRSRKEANVSQLKDRISQLETAVKQMSASVISFGDDLVRSGALDSHPELLKPLGNTMQACLGLPVLPYADSTYQMNGLSGSNPRQSNKLLTTSPTSSSSLPTDNMSIPEFIDRLHITCSYQAYLVTANPSISQRRLERPFWILLSLMPRFFVAEYFKDWLLAKGGHKTLDHWDHIPFFRVGGAGTHYATTENVYHPFPTPRSKPPVEEDVTRFTDWMTEGAEDDWFDMGDLQGYLKEREVVFPGHALAVGNVIACQKDQGAHSVARLMQRLVRGAICLGRSPGFRRRDVEAAIDEFVAAQDSLS